jgi:uncharacterized protein (TIGR03066 family)
MKLSKQIDKKKRQAAAKKPQVPPPAARRSPWRLLALGLCLLAAAGGSWAVFEYLVWNTLPPALVGKWVVDQGEQEGATFDFYRGGSMVGRVNMQGREGIIKARVRVEGDALFSTTQNPHSGQDETRRQKIKTITATSLVLEDEQGRVLRLSRAD